VFKVGGGRKYDFLSREPFSSWFAPILVDPPLPDDALATVELACLEVFGPSVPFLLLGGAMARFFLLLA
jgi:hypothetical protein